MTAARIWIPVTLSIFLVFISCRPSAAMTNEEFLAFCSAAEINEGQEPSEYPTPGKILQANRNIDVNFRGPGGQTPLMAAAANKALEQLKDNEEIILGLRTRYLRELLEAGAAANQQDEHGDTALLYALAAEPRLSTIQVLLNGGADPGVELNDGRSALEFAAAKSKNPDILGLLLIAYADFANKKQGSEQIDKQRLLKIAGTNPNHQVSALARAWVKAQPAVEPWQPVFATLPSDPELAQEIKNLDQRMQAGLREFAQEKDLKYSQIVQDYSVPWQIHLPSQLEMFQSLGVSQAEAWREAYAALLRSLPRNDAGLNPSAKTPADLIVQGISGKSEDRVWVTNKFLRDKQTWGPLFVLTKSKVLVTERPRGLTGYELFTGKELWLNPKSGQQYGVFENLIFSIEAVQDDGLEIITVIDVNDGRTLWQGYSPTFWLADPEKRFLIIACDDSVAKFDVTKYGQVGWITLQNLKFAKSGEYETPEKYLTSQGVNVAEYYEMRSVADKPGEYETILGKGPVGVSTENPYYNEQTIKFDLGQGRYLDRSQALATEIFGFNRFSLFFGREKNELILFDRQAGQFSPLHLGSGMSTTIQDVKFIKVKSNDGSDTFLDQAVASFSPSGNMLCLTDQNGNLHFFSAQDKGKFLGSLAGQTPVQTPQAATVQDLDLVSLLDDDPQNPIVLFKAPSQADALIVAQLDLTQGRVHLLPQPAEAGSVAVTAFALSAADKAAVGLDDGRLWLIDMLNGQMHLGGLKNESAWTALAYSPNGKFLTAADKDGQVMVIDEGFNILWRQAADLKGITRLATDNAGQRVWALGFNGSNYPHSSDSVMMLALFSKGGKPNLVDIGGKYGSEITGLRYNPTEDKGFLLTWKNDFEIKGNSQDNLLLKNVQAKVKAFSGSIEANDTEGGLRFDESFFTWSAQTLSGLSPDGNKLIMESGYSYTQAFNSHHVFDMSLDRIYRVDAGNIAPFPSGVASTGFSDDGRLLAAGEGSNRVGSKFLVYNLHTGDLVRRMIDSGKHPSGIQHIPFLHKQSRRLLTVGEESLRLWDLASPDPVNLLTWVFLKNGNTVVVGQDSRFDTPDIEQLDGVHWVVDHLPGNTVALAGLMRSYFQPRLAEYVLAGKRLPELPSIDKLNLTQHGVRLVGVEPEPEAPDHVAVTVEVYVRGKDPNHPAQELKLFRDGQLVGKYTGENNGLFDLPDGKKRITFRNIALPHNKMQVMFKAWAFNNDGVRSKYFERPYNYSALNKVAPRLHLVSMGVNNFDNPSWDLKYAVNDAKGFAEILPAGLPDVGTDVTLLASGEGFMKPDKEHLKTALQTLAAGGSSPDDVVVLTISSHGLTDDKDNKFYIIPADIPGSEKKITPELLARSISADELGDWLTGLDAAEIIMILDTCQSGAALGGESFKPGPMGDKGLGQIAYDKTMRVLSATNENNAAMELGNLGHGLLSYALLVDGLERGRGGDKRPFTFKDWLAYGKERTAELYAKIAKGENIGGTRGKVKVEKTVDNANPPLGQEPYLFDFGGIDKEIIRFRPK
ncbi:MAG: caspase family protein [Deltaproteobacteria bacterium]|jgi:hypothetical protein|nr:caspase family protein [Deltaproteobacteria bacterium]